MAQIKDGDSSSSSSSGNAITKEGEPLLRPLIALAVPSVLQAILSNMYGFNDFVFVGHMRDKAQSSIATTALSSIVGVQIIIFAFHNVVPSGSNTYISQHVGAKNYRMVSLSFRAAFYASIVLSTISGIIGYCLIEEISQVCGSDDRLVQEAIQKFLKIILLSSPFFSVMLLVDGYFKSVGDTKTPFYLELSSLLLNAALNYLLVIHYDYGIEGSAFATSLARMLPALYGLYKIVWFENKGISVSIALWQDTLSPPQIFSEGSSEKAATSPAPGLGLMSRLEVEMRCLESVVADDTASTSSKVGVMVEALTRTADFIDAHEVPFRNDYSGDDNENDSGDYCNDGRERGQRALTSDCRASLCDVTTTSWRMAKVGVFDSIASCIYGVCFTSLLRLCGLLGDKEQAGLGAGMRGIEWLAFCLSEGFLVAAATAVGQCVGAEAYKRAMDVTIICCSLSALAAGTVGVPFVIWSKEISQILTSDEEIVKYCAQYVYVQGWVMALVGFEMSSYGSLLGAGGASIICYVNGTCNLMRIPMAVYCLFGDQRAMEMVQLTLWAFGLHRMDAFPTPTGDFYCIGGVIAVTSGFKASIWLCYFSYLYFSGRNFRGSNVVKGKAAPASKEYSQLPVEEERV